jgi:hydroxymethylbilane synthase
VPEPRLRLGSRASPLARAQTESVRAALEARHPGLRVEAVFIRTSGDKLARGALAPMGGKGLFVKEIEEALAARTVDVGVHSMKDLPARLAPGLMLGGVPTRADARDVLLGGGRTGLAGLERGARVGTASVRRRALLLGRRPDLEVVLLRGNVDTRLRRWQEGTVDALVLAAAGLERLGLEPADACPLDPADFLPAVGQGALALECRVDDARTQALLAAIEDAPTAAAVAAERAFLLGIGGDCNTSLAAHATVADGRVALRVLVTDADGRRRLEDADSGPVGDADALGRALAERLLAAGAAEVLGR